jgi:hypothetical protein
MIYPYCFYIMAEILDTCNYFLDFVFVLKNLFKKEISKSEIFELLYTTNKST